MKAPLAFLILAGSLMDPFNVRAAAPESLTGGPADLDKAVDARAAKLGTIALADGPLGRLDPRKGGLVRVAFSDVLPIPQKGRGTAFIGHHVFAGGSDFALVTFPSGVEISTRASSVVVGSFAGTKEIAGVNGAKATVTVIAARVVGVIDGGTFAAGVPSFAPNSPIRVYELGTKKAPAKKTAS
jgi:hypothetical protein